MKVWVFVLCSFLLLAIATNAQDCSVVNNCSGNGQCRSNGVCACHDGYGFEDCSMVTTNCPSFCSGHGKCLNGTCICDTGFTGESCNIVAEACPFNCSGHGVCNSGKCACFPGLWQGSACDVEIYNCPTELNDCNGHGDCAPADPLNADSLWSCACDVGYCGGACDIVCGGCPQNCSGHGLCNNAACVCDDGFGGDDCSRVVEVSGCPNYCSGHGLCLWAGGKYQCSCRDCYSGVSCSESAVWCPGNCSGHGMCQCDGTCSCQSGYSGEACQEVESTCSELSYCSGNGVCSNHTCTCNPGYAGASCNLACSTGGVGTVGCNADRNHGRCISSLNDTAAVCQCYPEYTGVGCEKNTTSGMLDEYINGWNPIGTVVLMMAAVCVVAFVGGLIVNYVHGKRGINAVPGISSIRSKVKGTDYEGQRNESNY
eukprot:c4003_g1_i1.p1 GENE.c4003_g1_i1~~c4003_g1_i1.p1  ORF type:complete len:446 (+),score=111.23 c4003_g1_i1:59-1339(+)